MTRTTRAQRHTRCAACDEPVEELTPEGLCGTCKWAVIDAEEEARREARAAD